MGEAVASVQRRVKVELDLPIGDRYSEFIADLILQRNVRQLEAPHTGKNGCGHYIWRAVSLSVLILHKKRDKIG